VLKDSDIVTVFGLGLVIVYPAKEKQYENAKVVKLLLDAGTDLGFRVSRKLMLKATERNHKTDIKLLIAKDANIDIMDD
jgi:hypothetical protein